MNCRLLTALLIAGTIAPGCGVLRRSAKTSHPAPRAMQPPPQVQSEPQQLPAPPGLPAEGAEISQQPAMQQPELPGPPHRPRRPRPSPQVAEEAATAEPETPPAAPVPQLAQILTPEQKNSYSSAIHRDLERAQRTVNTLSQRKLTRDQSVYLERINSFIQQAGEARKTDLVRAASLAERAAVLADDLLRTIR